MWIDAPVKEVDRYLEHAMQIQENVASPPLIRDMPESDRPRERLIAVGERAVATTELLSILLRTGVGGESVNRLSERLQKHPGTRTRSIVL